MLLLVDALKSVFLSEQNIYSRVRDLADEKKETIIKNDLEKLKEITRLEEDALKALRGLEKEKLELLQGIAKKGNLQQLPNMTTIIHLVQDEGEKHKLRCLQAEFQQLIDDLRFKNELNQQLLQAQAQYTSFCLELMAQQSSVGDLYGSTGQVQEDTGTRLGLLDREV